MVFQTFQQIDLNPSLHMFPCSDLSAARRSEGVLLSQNKAVHLFLKYRQYQYFLYIRHSYHTSSLQWISWHRMLRNSRPDRGKLVLLAEDRRRWRSAAGGGAEPNKQPFISSRIFQRLLLFVGDRIVHVIIVLGLEAYFYILISFVRLSIPIFAF